MTSSHSFSHPQGSVQKRFFWSITGSNILSVFSPVRLADVPQESQHGLVSSSNERELHYLKQSSSFLVPWRVFSLLPSFLLPPELHFTAVRILRNTRKAEQQEEKLWCWLFFQVEELMKALFQSQDEQVGTVGLDTTEFCIFGGYPRRNQFLWDSHIVSHSVLKDSSSTESLQHAVGSRGSAAEQASPEPIYVHGVTSSGLPNSTESTAATGVSHKWCGLGHKAQSFALAPCLSYLSVRVWISQQSPFSRATAQKNEAGLTAG